MIPVYLSIAGSDCSAGAGIQADLKTGYALGCYPLTAVTCVVSEVPGAVESLVPMTPEFVANQIRLCLAHYPVAAIKTGMLYSPEIVQATAEALKGYAGPLVIDPVMIATAGEPLMLQTAIHSYETFLFPRAALLTPNMDELTCLSGKQGKIRSIEELQETARFLAERYRCAILAKGGHMEGEECTDVLALPSGETHAWAHPRVTGCTTHGTGCTLSSAVAAFLAKGLPLVQAVEHALHAVAQAIASSHHTGELWALNHAAMV